MQTLNAIDAIGPAFTRTHEILFKPFRVGRTWKLAVTQYLGLIGAFFVPFPLVFPFLPGPAAARGLAFVVGLILAAFLFVFFYFGARLQFVNFEMVVTRQQFVAPMWRRYGKRVWPVIGFKTALGTGLLIAASPILFFFGRGFMRAIEAMPKSGSGEQVDPAAFGNFFGQIVGFYLLFFAGFTLFKAFSTAFEDFVLPFYILEDISLRAALARGWTVFVADPLGCMGYLIMKLVLFIAGFMMQYISNLIVLIPIVLIAIVVGAFGIGLSSGHSVHSSSVLLVSLAVLFYACAIVVMFWYQMGSLGYLSMLLEAYAIYFLGGRYPLLGDMLEPPPAYLYTPPPVFPSPEERRDDDEDGPSLPMDPALA